MVGQLTHMHYAPPSQRSFDAAKWRKRGPSLRVCNWRGLDLIRPNILAGLHSVRSSEVIPQSFNIGDRTLLLHCFDKAKPMIVHSHSENWESQANAILKPPRDVRQEEQCFFS